MKEENRILHVSRTSFKLVATVPLKELSVSLVASATFEVIRIHSIALNDEVLAKIVKRRQLGLSWPFKFSGDPVQLVVRAGEALETLIRFDYPLGMLESLGDPELLPVDVASTWALSDADVLLQHVIQPGHPDALKGAQVVES